MLPITHPIPIYENEDEEKAEGSNLNGQGEGRIKRFLTVDEQNGGLYYVQTKETQQDRVVHIQKSMDNSNSNDRGFVTVRSSGKVEILDGRLLYQDDCDSLRNSPNENTNLLSKKMKLAQKEFGGDLKDLRMNILVCCEHMGGVILMNEDNRAYYFSFKDGLSAVYNNAPEVRSKILCCTMVGRRIFVGCENGGVIDFERGKLSANLGEDVITLLSIHHEHLLAIGRNGRCCTLSAHSPPQFFSIPGPVRAAITFGPSSFLHWSRPGILYRTKISGAVHAPNDTVRISVDYGRVIDILPLSSTKVTIVLSTGHWLIYQAKQNEPTNVASVSLNGLIDEIRSYEIKEKDLDKLFVPIQQRMRFLSIVSELVRNPHPASKAVRLLPSSTCYKFLCKLPFSLSDFPLPPCLSVIISVKQGEKRQSQSLNLSVCSSAECEFVFDLDNWPVSGRLLPIDVIVTICAGFNLISNNGLSKLIAQERFDALDTGELDKDTDDVASHASCSLVTFKATRDVLGAQMFQNDHPAKKILQMILPTNWEVTTSTALRASAFTKRTNIQLQIDGNEVEVKAICSDRFVSVVIQEALIRRSATIFLKPILLKPASLSVQRAVLDAMTTLEASANSYPRQRSRQALDSMQKACHAWSIARGLS
jgi:hypothetical protein